MQIRFDEAIPIYEQIMDLIKKKIALGEYQSGDKLPSQRKMARKIEVNPNTIQRAYREMENMGLVETRRGMGTFISDDQEVIGEIREEMVREAVGNFVQEMFSLGYTGEEIIKKVIDFFEEEESE
ncbi:MAG: GntR family transcriptional regulator [Halanaerobiaceae bacterium]